MQFQISYQDGQPRHVQTWDGYCQCSRAFDPEKDGWMLEQATPSDFPHLQSFIGAAEEIRDLYSEVQRLRRENWQLKQQTKLWRGAAGFTD